LGLNDKELSACLSENLEGWAQSLADGIPEFDLASMDPFTYKQYDYVLNLRPFPVIPMVKVTDIVIRHLSKINVANLKLDTAGKRMTFEILAPLLQANGRYATGGNLWFLALLGKGTWNIDINGGKGAGGATFKMGRDSTGQEVLQIDQLKLDLDYDNIKLEVDGILHGHEILKRTGPLFNRYVNEHSKELWEIIKPEVVVGVSDIIKSIINKTLAKMPGLVKYF